MVINYDWGNDVITKKKERPNFVIVEEKTPTVDYEDFKQDFLSPYMTKDYICRKHNLSRGDYNQLRKKVLEEENIERKPFRTQIGWAKLATTSYIQKVGDKEYIIIKRVNNRAKYFGRYRKLSTAQMVRDELVRNDWDAKLAEELKLKYGLTRRKPLYDRAVKLFPEWEEYYVNSKLPIVEINKKLNVSLRMYRYLTDMIHKKYGIKNRCSINDITSG